MKLQRSSILSSIFLILLTVTLTVENVTCQDGQTIDLSCTAVLNFINGSESAPAPTTGAAIVAFIARIYLTYVYYVIVCREDPTFDPSTIGRTSELDNNQQRWSTINQIIKNYGQAGNSKYGEMKK